MGHVMLKLVEAVRQTSEGRGFDFRQNH